MLLNLGESGAFDINPWADRLQLSWISEERLKCSGRFVHDLRILVMDKAKAREELSKSDKQIEENDSQIRQQEEQFKQLAAYGHETEAAQGQLKDLKQEKESNERHRDLVREDLNEK